MSASASPCSLSLIVARLRSAGCVFAEDEARLLSAAARTDAELAELVDQRTNGLPLEHILGWAEFCDLRIAVDPGVFIPRRRTEFLVDQAALLARKAGSRAVVLDLCCGSGAVGAAVLAALGQVELHAVDIDPVAVNCARRNVPASAGQVYEGDLYEPLPATLRGRVDVMVANAPYVPTEAIGLLPAEARLHEARVALDGGADGLEVVGRIIAGAALWLRPGGSLLVETSDLQAPHAVKTLASCGLMPLTASSGELSATVVIGNRPVAARLQGVEPLAPDHH